MRIKTKFILVLTPLLAAVCILIFLTAPADYERNAIKAVTVRSQSIAEMTAYSLSPALFFNDQEEAINEVLLSAQQNEDLAYIIVFDSSGKEVAAYKNNGEILENVYRMRDLGVSTSGRFFRARAPISYKDNQLGELFLGLSLKELRKDMDSIRKKILFFSFFTFILGTTVIFSLSTLITRPLHRMTKTTRQIADGDLTQRADISSQDEVGHLAKSFNAMVAHLQNSHDQLENAKLYLEKRVEERTTELQAEISDRKKAEKALQEANRMLSQSVLRLEQHNIEMSLLSELGDSIQACNTEEEIFSISTQIAKKLFSKIAGALYLSKSMKDLFELVLSWGDFNPIKNFLEPDECWALRRGKSYIVKHQDASLICPHLKNSSQPHIPYLCVPMVAQGETIGLLHLQCPQEMTAENQDLPSTKATQTCEIVLHLALNFNERIAMALSNLRLRNTLRQQSIRDPLTGLFNRRYMEETLDREIYRSQRLQSPLGIIMLDIDFFKHFNDDYGHEAGDLMLREIGQFLLSHIRKGDVACRYGGEEFTLILPSASLDIAKKRAELLLKEVKKLRVEYGGEALGPITLSLGISIFPNHGETSTAVLKAADKALLQAKKEGRSRIVISTQTIENKERKNRLDK